MRSTTHIKKGNSSLSSTNIDEKYLPEYLIENITSPDVPIHVSLDAILGYWEKEGPDWALRTCKNGCNIAHLVVESKKVSLAKRLLSHPKLTKGVKFMMREKKKFRTGKDCDKDALTIAIMQGDLPMVELLISLGLVAVANAIANGCDQIVPVNTFDEEKLREYVWKAVNQVGYV